VPKKSETAGKMVRFIF